jgi:hypothetical protein
MKYFLFIIALGALAASCNSHVKKTPPAPKSAAEVLAHIKNKKYKVEKLGILSPFKSDSLHPVNWNIEAQDTSDFFRKYAAKQRLFELVLNGDSLVTFMDTDAQKMVTGRFAVMEDWHPQDEKVTPGIVLNLVYSDSVNFGGGNIAAKMTHRLLVRGAGEHDLLLQTQRAYNDRPLVLWLKAQ